MHIKVLFEPGSGKLLGAQVVGYDGVDKRLDVFATAIRAGMTVHDLERLELAYAPPYGSAKDPVNMAGFVGSNLLKGDVKFWYAEEFPAGTAEAFILDVRGAQEYELGHIPGAVNIPLGKLRSKLDTIPRDKPVLVYCKVGFRSYLAYRVLRQRGIERVATLAGGMLTFCCYQDPGSCTGAPEPAVLPYAEEAVAVTGVGVGDRRENAVAGTANATRGTMVELDCTGLQCPGPIKRMKEEMDRLAAGDLLQVRATDPGFEADAVAWCRRQGHEMVEIGHQGPVVLVKIRKGVAVVEGAEAQAVKKDKKTFVVFSGDLDKVMAAFVIANGAQAMGNEVTMFFTFWGLNALRKAAPQAAGKGMLDWMFGWMMPKGASRLTLSNMNMMGMGTAMMKHVMKSKRVESLPELMAAAQAGGAKMVACSMSMDVMGIRREELIDGIEVGGVASFLGEADQSNVTMFI
jgi:peroxiredoxin family protein/rhodanese-related sulfurtransferase/TusA-related sulfurtransferase